jgi:(1->4)-alpha-D-glucan 1-alpha-D-glucosylmutase
VDYLHALGVSDCYASSYLVAVPGSPHGYDVADPTRLNPEIGTEQEYWDWIEALQARGMGQVLDVVPNHMGIAKSANPWWLDVLENGPSSRFARFFDVEWHPVKAELTDKVLLPILGDQYGTVLEHQDLQLSYSGGAFFIVYGDNRLPVAPDTYGTIFAAELEQWLASASATSGDEIDELLSVLTASLNLPPRETRDPDLIVVRAREKEMIKRRLGALADRSESVRTLIDSCVRHFNGIRGQARSFDFLDGLLNAQSYRLAHWRVASEEVNYRRFFDVNELAALRMEDPTVFEEVHRFLFELVRRGAATGLRIDHVDGLFAPGAYLHRLQLHAAEQLQQPDALYIVVEKVLGRDERLPETWPVNGTTGYEFAAVVNNLFVDTRSERALDDIYRRFVRDRTPFEDLSYRSKKLVLHETMSGDINSLGHQLNRFSERNRHFRDFTLYSLISALKDVIACFPVYRTYVTAEGPPSDDDRRYIASAVRCAKQRGPRIMGVVFDFVERLLLKQTTAVTREECEDRERFIGKFQQLTSPVAAKGIEDTALYIYNRLLSLNEVGSDPTQFGLEPPAVHEWMDTRQRHWPAALSATSTHDTKRGEDARARLNVLSEIPGAWKAAVAKWRALNRRFKTEVKGALVPDANEEYFLYQTLVGVWPFEHGAGGEALFRDRVTRYIQKTLREAKVHTSWLSPDEAYEKAVIRFVEALLDRRRAGPFLQSFEPFQARVAELGIYNSLAQLLIKVTAPGVPDFYQGTELWDFNLVDPDNRRPVDYDSRTKMLTELFGHQPPQPFRDIEQAVSPADATRLVEHHRDGRVKMFVMARALAARAKLRAVYERGEYVPLQTGGSQRNCLFAFARRLHDSLAISCVPRLIGSLIPEGGTLPLGRAIWTDTRIELPRWAARSFRHVFTGATIEPEESNGSAVVSASALFEHFPVALLISG